MLKEINPALSVSFSGHRPDRLPGSGDPNIPETEELIAALREHIEGAVKRGKVFYLHGAMAGFDLLAASQVIVLKAKYPQLRLVTIAPYKEHFFSRENCWTPAWVNLARGVFREQDMGVKVAERYRPGIYYERNRILIGNSSELICYHDGGRGGTKYTVDLAISKNLSVYNLYGG